LWSRRYSGRQRQASLSKIGDDDARAHPIERHRRRHDADRPLPITKVTSPGAIFAFDAACIPMANGSTRAPSAKLTLSGSL
jgi:hypothetical protein